MKEKKMFGKGEKRLAECFSLSVWVTRFQPTDNGYIGLFWGERGKKGGREEEKYDGKNKKERLWEWEIARGGGYYHLNRVGSFPFTGDLPSYRP